MNGKKVPAAVFRVALMLGAILIGGCASNPFNAAPRPPDKFEKLGAASRTEAVAIAQRRGILREESEGLHAEVGAVRIGKRSGVRQSRPDANWSGLTRLSPFAVARQ